MYNIYTKRKIWVAVVSAKIEDDIEPAVETHRELFHTKSAAWDYVSSWNNIYKNVCSFAVLDCEYIPRKNSLHAYTAEIYTED